MKRIKVFISSVQSEFAAEREMLCSYIRSDALLGKFFEPFIFEEVPATDSTPQKVYIEAVEQSDIYIGLFGNRYGYEDSEGVSPTEREYDKASERHLPRLIFIKSIDEDQRHPKEVRFIQKVEQDIVRRTFVDLEGLRTSVYASLVRYMEQKGIVRWKPFDAATDTEASVEDLDEDKMRNFIYMARQKRKFPLPETTSPLVLLKHLDLIDDNGRLANAAILLFGKKPQHYFLTSEVKCAQFYGTRVEKPVPTMQIFKGDVFQLVSEATNFVMSHIDIWTGTREQGTRSELPFNAVQEAICNAICHRDYSSNGSVQIMLFKDRLEIWNPGCLPYGLTPEKLHQPHKSLPANPLIAEPMYLSGLIEKMGTGTEDIIRECLDWELPMPEFHQEVDFRVTIWRKRGDDVSKAHSNVVKDVVKDVVKELTERQEIILAQLKAYPSIKAIDLAQKTNTTSRTIQRDLSLMQKLGIIAREGGRKEGCWIVLI